MNPQRMAPVAVVAQGLASATGVGLDTLLHALREGRHALVDNSGPHTFTHTPLPTWVGAVPGLMASPWPRAWAAWDCRATRLAWLGLQADNFMAAAQAACQRHGAARVGLVLGTSASTIGASEQAYRLPADDGGFPAPLRHEALNTLHALADFVQQALGLQGPSATVSTACSSSAKAFAQAERWLRLGLVDAVVVGGVDALCNSLLFGFHALQLVSPTPCRPFAAERCGISVGEAAGFCLLERGPGALCLVGYGESNDAHHMSSPHPEGLGAERALDAALARAGLTGANSAAGALAEAPPATRAAIPCNTADDIGYLNLHGTASARNDAVEAALVARRYAATVHASATKGVTGHTMGAAGMVAALVCLLALRDDLCAGSVGSAPVDPTLGPVFARQLQRHTAVRPVKFAASHSFGFGGNNAVLVFGRGL